MAENSKFTFSGLLVLGVFLTLGIWTYQQVSTIYQNMETSHQMVESLVNNQSQVIKAYRDELGLLKKNLASTEELVSQLKNENEKLQEKLVLLDKVTELEETINRLKERNALIINHMSTLKEKNFIAENEVKSIKDGRKLIAEYRNRLSKIKGRIKDLKITEQLARIDAQRERDKKESLAGNSGYLVRNGRIVAVGDFSEKILTNKNIEVNVTFVK